MLVTFGLGVVFFPLFIASDLFHSYRSAGFRVELRGLKWSSVRWYGSRTILKMTIITAGEMPIKPVDESINLWENWFPGKLNDFIFKIDLVVAIRGGTNCFRNTVLKAYLNSRIKLQKYIFSTIVFLSSVLPLVSNFNTVNTVGIR